MLERAVAAAFEEDVGHERGGAELHRDGFALLAGLGFEHGEMEVGAGGVAGVAGESDELSGLNFVAEFDLHAVFLEMDVMTEGAIRMLNENIVSVPLELFIGATDA